MNNILISKNNNAITIFNKGSKLVIDINNKLFNILKNKTKEEIITWYQNER